MFTRITKNMTLPSCDHMLKVFQWHIRVNKRHLGSISMSLFIVVYCRTYSNPPELVKSVLRAVCVLFQKKDDWANAKQMVKEPDFLKNLLTLDKDQLPGRVCIQ